jgi:2-phospho-L-lactate guanylyltransferase (CobY/MobA/RfbA family)
VDGATAVAEPGGGQGAAVAAGLDVAVARGGTAPFVVVNADVPCATSRELYALADAVPEHGLAIVRARDGTTNALAFSSVALFEPLYGPGSADRFAALAASRELDCAGLVEDVDTLRDLERLRARLGPRTRSAYDALRLGAAA